jgi:hypothetical protein
VLEKWTMHAPTLSLYLSLGEKNWTRSEGSGFWREMQLEHAGILDFGGRY